MISRFPMRSKSPTHSRENLNAHYTDVIRMSFVRAGGAGIRKPPRLHPYDVKKKIEGPVRFLIRINVTFCPRTDLSLSDRRSRYTSISVRYKFTLFIHYTRYNSVLSYTPHVHCVRDGFSHTHQLAIDRSYDFRPPTV